MGEEGGEVGEEEEAEDWWLVEVLRGWLGGGFEGLGGAGAGFLAERVEVKPHGKNTH